MFDNVKSMEAFKQKTDFCGGDVPYIIRRGSDIDFTYELANDRIVAVEEKKETFNHSVDKIISSPQWKHYRKVCRDEHYLVYATHNCEISDKEDIPIEALTVKYMETNNQEVEIPEGLKLTDLLNYLGSLNTYYIKVHYKDDTIEYALKHPIDNRWSCNKYWSAYVSFSTKDNAIDYINTRYKKEFNRDYIYEIWQVNEDGNNIKLDEISYKTE